MVLGFRKKDKVTEGFVRYDVTFIDERTRKRCSPSNSNLFTRKYGIVPKSGDYMEMGRSCIGGSGTYFVPVRLSEFSFENRWNLKEVSFDLDMLDTWGSAPISRGRDFDRFREYCLNGNKERELRNQNVRGIYKTVLVEPNLNIIHEEKRVCVDPEMISFNFLPGVVPFPENFSQREAFPPLNGISVEELKVVAVLHPLYGPSKVLIQRGEK